MREIKFRAWDSKHKMVRLDVAAFSNGNFKYMNLHDEDVYNIDGDVLMQYTGLKDKNGKEIYEGDIVKSRPDFRGEIVFGKVDVFFVETTAFLLKYKDSSIGGIGEDVEVIGNKFENPELL